MKNSRWKGKRVVLGVTGSIACFKAAALASELTQRGAEVTVVMTQAAQKFVTPLTFSSLTGHRVYSELFDPESLDEMAHIDLGDKADLVLVAPATAHVIAKFACGLADDLLSTLVLSTRAPVVVAPAMNVNMYENPIVERNLASLRERGFGVIEPDCGHLACGWVGSGRLPEPVELLDSAQKHLDKCSSAAVHQTKNHTPALSSPGKAKRGRRDAHSGDRRSDSGIPR